MKITYPVLKRYRKKISPNKEEFLITLRQFYKKNLIRFDVYNVDGVIDVIESALDSLEDTRDKSLVRHAIGEMIEVCDGDSRVIKTSDILSIIGELETRLKVV